MRQIMIYLLNLSSNIYKYKYKIIFLYKNNKVIQKIYL